MKKSVYCVLSHAMILSVFLLLSACGSDYKNQEQSFSSVPYVPAVETTPSTLNKYAVASDGKVEIEGEFITDGPLADIISNDTIHVGNNKPLLRVM